MRVFNGVINTHVLVRWVRNACRDDRDERIITGRFPWRVRVRARVRVHMCVGSGWQVCSVTSASKNTDRIWSPCVFVRIIPTCHVATGTTIKHAHRLFSSFKTKSLRMIPIS